MGVYDLRSQWADDETDQDEAAAGRIDLVGHTGPVYGVDLTRDNQLVLSASGDATLRLWHLELGACLNLYRYCFGSSMCSQTAFRRPHSIRPRPSYCIQGRPCNLGFTVQRCTALHGLSAVSTFESPDIFVTFYGDTFNKRLLHSYVSFLSLPWELAFSLAGIEWSAWY